MVAYYCFVNLGWPPSKYADMSYEERSLVSEFVLKDIKQRKKEQEEIKRQTKAKGKKR